MDRKEELIFIAKNPEKYLQTSGMSLESRLEEVRISSQEQKGIIKEKTIKTVRNKGLSLFGSVGDAVSTILNWNEEVNQEISEAKEMILLGQYFDKVDDQAKAIAKLKDFLISVQGNTLFNKILRLLDDSPPDEELLDHLSSVLKTVVESGRFEDLFEQHKYALAQIERLTPQSLTIIADYNNWPSVKLGSYQSMGTKVTSDWDTEFTRDYCHSKRIVDNPKHQRIQHSIIELQRQGLKKPI